MRNCTICNKPIVLAPTAQERAAKYGGKPSDYTNAFTTHAARRRGARTHGAVGG